MMISNLIYATLTVILIFFVYEVFNLVDIPPEEDGDEEDERQAIIASMSRQHLR
jgi:hypothetical protein